MTGILDVKSLNGTPLLSTAVNGAQVLITVSQDGSASAPAFIPVR